MMAEPVSVLLLALIFVVAALYASVGHGGASGYLAIMSLFAFSPQQMAGTALVLNIFVSCLAFWSYRWAGHVLPKFSWLLIVAALPLSFLGGALPVRQQLYAVLLAIALAAAALRLLLSPRESVSQDCRPPQFVMAVLSGGGIGLLSGIVGVGGGIFLSPLAVLARWAPLKSVATLSALFILLNSVTGLMGRWATGKLELDTGWFLLCAALPGGWVGAYLGSQKLDSKMLRGLLAVVLLVAAGKLAWIAL